jgi:hypothetical protein
MGTTHEGNEQDRFRRHVQSADFEIIKMIAESMRTEFGDTIDAHPGGVGTEAGALNRAFRISVCVILNRLGSLGDEPGVQTLVVRQVALRRLQDLGLIGHRAERILDLEPKLGDAWLTYLALAPASVIDDLLEQ